MTSTPSPLRHLLQACTALTLLTAPTLAQLDCAAAAQAELARLVARGDASPGCDAAAPDQICSASGRTGPCSLLADCPGPFTPDGCTDPAAGAYGSYGGDADEGCCIVLYTHACGAAEAPAPRAGGRRLSAESSGGTGCEDGAHERAAMCEQRCGASADGTEASGATLLAPEEDEGPVVVGFARKGGRGGGGRRSRGSASAAFFHSSGAGPHPAAAGAVIAGVVAAVAAAL